VTRFQPRLPVSGDAGETSHVFTPAYYEERPDGILVHVVPPFLFCWKFC
jgi:hypothetical protein